MRKLFRVLAAASLTCLVAASSAEYTLEGVVLERDTGLPIEGAQQRADPDGELRDVVGLGQEIVGAGLEGEDPVDLARLSAHDEDRDPRGRRVLADQAHEAEPGEVRQRQLEQHEVDALGCERVQRLPCRGRTDAARALAQALRGVSERCGLRVDDEDPFEPAVLVIACGGLAALHIQHETSEIIGRVNAFLGFNAIGRIRIVQKPVQAPAAPVRAKLRPLDAAEAASLSGKVADIEDGDLRASLERLGRSVLGERRRPS